MDLSEEFAALVRSEHPRLVRVVLVLANSRADAEDAV